jgi:hypothetical protein
MDGPIHISHAKEDQVPGTVYLIAEEGDETYYGQALFPIPTADPNDPLNLPRWRKYCCLISVVLFTLVGNASILMPAPFIIPWTEEYGVTAQEASTVETYPVLMYALINLIWVPFALKFGRRPVWLLAVIIFIILYNTPLHIRSNGQPSSFLRRAGLLPPFGVQYHGVRGSGYLRNRRSHGCR